jgi:hypothetical protein
MEKSFKNCKRLLGKHLCCLCKHRRAFCWRINKRIACRNCLNWILIRRELGLR